MAKFHVLFIFNWLHMRTNLENQSPLLIGKRIYILYIYMRIISMSECYKKFDKYVSATTVSLISYLNCQFVWPRKTRKTFQKMLKIHPKTPGRCFVIMCGNHGIELSMKKRQVDVSWYCDLFIVILAIDWFCKKHIFHNFLSKLKMHIIIFNFRNWGTTRSLSMLFLHRLPVIPTPVTGPQVATQTLTIGKL